MRNASRRTMVGAVVGLLIFAGARVAVGQVETGALRDTAVAPQPQADNGNDLGPGQMVLPDNGGYVQPSPATSNVYAPPRSDSGTYAPPDSSTYAPPRSDSGTYAPPDSGTYAPPNSNPSPPPQSSPY